tara:strand:+ start:541 stop:1701 length:1161 start_codon:yes stop_codon:yes gene_type:complete
MDDLLKEAIADAKAVRETALQNAKIALEEAFTPRLKSMLSKKIQSEMEEEDDDVEERMKDEDEDDDNPVDINIDADGDDDDDDDMEERMHDEEEKEEGMHDEEEKEEGMHDEDEDMKDESKVIEIDGVKYAPVVSEEDDDPEERAHEDEDDMDEGDLDLEAVIKELETEMDDEKEEGMHDEDEDDMKEEVDATTGIGTGDNKKATADKSSNIGAKDKAKFTEGAHEDDEKEKEEDMEEDIDLEEVLKALSEEEEEEKKEESKNEISNLKSELEEHRNVVKYLRSKLNEVNLLNAKLLFTNKLFRSNGLTNEQKMKVVETFDRATNLREVKLVFSTLAESFGSKKIKNIKESKGSASKAVSSTKPKKEVISEGSELRDRFKKLAGIL